MICCTVCKYVNRLMLLDKRDWLVCGGGLVEVLLNSNGAKFCWKKINTRHRLKRAPSNIN